MIDRSVEPPPRLDMPTTRHLLKPEGRRALELLAPCRNGSTETMMVAHGFSIDMMGELINSGLATVQTERFVAADYQGERERMRITPARRRAILWGQLEAPARVLESTHM